MWKIIVGFVIFAAIVMYVLSKAGGSVDMSGEKHGGDTLHAPAEAPAAAPAAPAPAPAK